MKRATVPLLLACSAVQAAPAAASAPDPAAGLLQVLLGLVAVLGLMAGAAWLLKRLNRAGTGGTSAVRIIGGVSVGSRERVLVLEVGDQWIVVGVGAGRVNALSTMPRQADAVPAATTPATANFAGWLKQITERGHASD